MKKAISFWEFQNGFDDVDRSNSFSDDGLRALYDYLVELEEDLGTEIEFDPIAFCVEFSEFGWDEIANYYDIDLSDCEDDDDRIEAVGKYLNYRTFVVAKLSNGNFVYQDF